MKRLYVRNVPTADGRRACLSLWSDRSWTIERTRTSQERALYGFRVGVWTDAAPVPEIVAHGLLRRGRRNRRAPSTTFSVDCIMTIEPIPDPAALDRLLCGPETRWVAYCVEPGCRCLDRAGVIVASPDAAPAGYEVRQEIAGGTYAGMTPAEVVADKAAFEAAGGAELVARLRRLLRPRE